MVKLRQIFELTPRRIALGYAVFGVLWVGLSDRFVYFVFERSSVFIAAQRLKGWVFVSLSAGLILGLTRSYHHQLADTEKRVVVASEQLQVLHRIFRHNIRNDLTTILGYAKLLEEQTRWDGAERWARTIRNTAVGLVETSEKLGIVNTVDVAGGVESSIELRSVLEAEVSTLRSAYPAATFEVDLPERLLVSANPSIRFAIREALQNAMDHHPASESERRIEVTATETLGEVSLEISDNGPGIHPDEIDPIRDGSETALDHGSGIGLWIIAWLCESSGGAVGFDTEDGTTVTITLERADPVEHVTEKVQQDFFSAVAEQSS